jgi:hypothetical protein
MAIRGPDGQERSHEYIFIDRLHEIKHEMLNVTDRIGLQKSIMWPYDTSDLPRDKKYFEAQKELGILELRLKNLEAKERMINNILNNSNPNNLPPITVPQDQGYEIPNGLIGFKRDLFNKLATHRLVDGRDIQERYGISQGTVPWKDHFTFTFKRPHAPPPDLNPAPKGHYRKK